MSRVPLNIYIGSLPRPFNIQTFLDVLFFLSRVFLPFFKLKYDYIISFLSLLFQLPHISYMLPLEFMASFYLLLLHTYAHKYMNTTCWVYFVLLCVYDLRYGYLLLNDQLENISLGKTNGFPHRYFTYFYWNYILYNVFWSWLRFSNFSQILLTHLNPHPSFLYH